MDGIFEVCGVPPEKIRSISSAVDKLDKVCCLANFVDKFVFNSIYRQLPWIEVRKEMTEEKGLDGVIADRIGEYVKHKGGPELLAQLKADTTLTANKNAKEGLADMAILFTLLRAYKVLDRVCSSYSSLGRRNSYIPIDIL